MPASLAYINALNRARLIVKQAAEDRAANITREVHQEAYTLERLTGLTPADAARIAEAHYFTN